MCFLRPSHCLSLLQHHETFFPGALLHLFLSIYINVHVFFRACEEKGMSWCLKFKVHCNKCTDFSFVNWFHKLSDQCVVQCVMDHTKCISDILYITVYLFTLVGFYY